MTVMLISVFLAIALSSNALVSLIQAAEIASSTRESGFVPEWFPEAPPVAPPKGEVITVANVDELFSAVENIGEGGTISISKGQYKLSRPIILREKKDISIRTT